MAHQVRPPVVEGDNFGQQDAAIDLVIVCCCVGGLADYVRELGGHDDPVAEGGASRLRSSSHEADHAGLIFKNSDATPGTDEVSVTGGICHPVDRSGSGSGPVKLVNESLQGRGGILGDR